LVKSVSLNRYSVRREPWSSHFLVSGKAEFGMFGDVEHLRDGRAGQLLERRGCS
jgi:hypothetical protein